MPTNIQQYFRYYLAVFLSILLAVGVRLQGAPLGADLVATEEVNTPAPPVVQVGAVTTELASR